LRTLIIDDEPLAREELKYLLSSEPGVEVCGEGTNGIEAVQLIRDSAPDLVFLDVQMPGLDGFAVLKRLVDKKEKKSRLPQIVFATAFDQYAVRAFEVNAVDYLLKPFDKKRVRQAVEKARAVHEVHARAALDLQARHAEGSPDTAEEEALEAGADATLGANLDALVRLLEQRTEAKAATKAASRVALRAQSRLVLVDQKDICFASIEEGAITVVTAAVEGQANHRTLEDLLDTLDPGMFWRAHRSFVVNINHIREVVPWFKSSYQLRMGDRKHTEIPVSRAQTKRLRELFNL
jgi:two-component system LytT family response regulator/two-component system response regulator LytT